VMGQVIVFRYSPVDNVLSPSRAPPPTLLRKPFSRHDVGTPLEFLQIFMYNLPLPMEFPCKNYPSPWNFHFKLGPVHGISNV
jgi:hypothetical protein